MFTRTQLTMIVHHVVSNQLDLQTQLPMRTGGISIDVRTLAKNTGHERFNQAFLQGQIREAFGEVGLSVQEMYDGVIAVLFEGATVGSDSNGLYVHVADRGTFALPTISAVMQASTTKLFRDTIEATKLAIQPNAGLFSAKQLDLLVNMVATQEYERQRTTRSQFKENLWLIDLHRLAHHCGIQHIGPPHEKQIKASFEALGLKTRQENGRTLIVDFTDTVFSTTALGDGTQQFNVNSPRGVYPVPLVTADEAGAFAALWAAPSTKPEPIPAAVNAHYASTDPAVPTHLEVALFSRFHKLIATNACVQRVLTAEELGGVGQFGNLLWGSTPFDPIAWTELLDGRKALLLNVPSDNPDAYVPIVIAEMVYDAHGAPVQLYSECRAGKQSIAGGPLVHDPLALYALRAATTDHLDVV